jgi:molecular chaperone GrpE
MRIPILNNEKNEDMETEELNEETTESADENPLEAELAETKAQLVQLAADFENYKRQATRRESEARDRAVRSVVEDLLPVLDNFERAVQAAESASDMESLRVGIGFILQMFQEALRNNGVTPIEAKGQSFDPLHHEAIAEVESDKAPGTVVEEAQRGYVYKGHVLRASRVKVAA